MADFSLCPEDVFINILLRLPIKYVFRSRSVCKNWNFVLRSSNFSSLYNKHQLCKQERLANDGVSTFIFLEYVENDYFDNFSTDDSVKFEVYFPYDAKNYGGWYGENDIYDAHPNDYRVDFDSEHDSNDHAHVLLSFVTLKKMNNELITIVERVEKLDIIFTSFKDRVAAGYTKFTNVYDGIICLENKIEVILYNPYTRESQRLPFRPCTIHRHQYHIVLGLWFESNLTIKHYKVFSLLILQNGGEDPACTYVIEKYDSIEGSWTEIKIMPNQKYPLCRDNCLLFNEILHLYVDDHKDSLITLDVRSETLGLLPLPTGISEWNIRNSTSSMDSNIDGKSRNIESCFLPHIFVLGRSLAMFAQNTHRVSCIDIWMMTEYGVKESWTKQYTIPPEEYFTLGDFYTAPSNYDTGLYYWTPPYTFKLRWRLLLNWKCMDEDEMILETRNWNIQGYDFYYDARTDKRTKLVSFNLVSNKLTEIAIRVSSNTSLLSVVSNIETLLSLE